MMSGKKMLVGFIVLVLCFILPLNIYIIGDNLGAGIQGAFFRFQVTGYGDSFIFLNQELGYVITGIYMGKTALSILFWIIADALLLLGTTFCLMQPGERTIPVIKNTGIFFIAGGILFLISCIIQYGFFFHGDAGTSIPIGVPLILISGWFIHYHSEYDMMK
jgi:hypothetical protein